jgi:sigma-B regulation protein RsbU (phosphoserine phosphatase)
VDLEVTGPALGIFKSAKFQVKQLGFHRGDILFAFTDGLVDARSPGGEAFGLSRVATMLSNVKSVECNVSELLKTVLSAVKHHCGTAEQFDDMTILIMKSGST